MTWRFSELKFLRIELKSFQGFEKKKRPKFSEAKLLKNFVSALKSYQKISPDFGKN